MSYWKIILIGAFFIVFILIGFVIITKNFENKEQIDNSENAGSHIPIIVENGNLNKKTKTIKIFDNLELKQNETKCTDVIDIGEYNKVILFHIGPPKEDVPSCSSSAEVCCHLPTSVYGNYVFENKIFRAPFDLPAIAYSTCDESSASKAFDIAFPKIQLCIHYDYKEDNDPDLTQFPSILKNTSSYIFLTQ